ncbi:hypothetical protein TrRE_jg7758 [Triparma retinervis]|uniref:U6 snRNA-associated Sm-like protein LSm8 n=1 Tax=Triparma retinervis TaxID=2557542 RepID=A0A9W6ZZ77_9STRA|nr:hypothetical protein TrRE_jg7758 [Triparma retinervis]
MASTLKELIDKKVNVVCLDGRNLIGILSGYDQVQNLVLTSCHERLYTLHSPCELVPLGAYIVRGDNLAVLGELDEEEDARRDIGGIRATQIRPVMHTQS